MRMVKACPRWLVACFTVLAVVFYAPVARADKPTRETLVQRARANATYWRELATVTLEIALQVPATDTGRDAVRLYIDTLTALQWDETPPVEIYDELAKAIPNLVAGYCRAEDIPKYPEPCGILTQIQLDVRRYLTLPTPSNEIDTPEKFQAFALREAESLVKLWHDVGEPLCAAKSPACSRMAVVLASAADYFKAAHQMGRAMDMRRILIDPRYGMDKTRSAQFAVCHGADDLAESLLDFEEAASWYERCAKEVSTRIYESHALRMAVNLRLLLGDEPAARRAMVALPHTSGPFGFGEIERAALSIADYDVRAEKWADAEQWLTQEKSLFDATQQLDAKLVYHATLARIALGRGRNEKAFAEYGVVRQLWKTAPPAAKTFDTKNPYFNELKEILEAVGEAEFFFAQRAEKAVDAIQFSPYRGPLVEKPVYRYIMEHRKIELTKFKAIERASEEYHRVLEIEPVAPPRWVIAAANRLGNLWAAFARDVENVPKLSGPVPGTSGVTYEERMRHMLERRRGGIGQRVYSSIAWSKLSARSISMKMLANARDRWPDMSRRARWL